MGKTVKINGKHSNQIERNLLSRPFTILECRILSFRNNVCARALAHAIGTFISIAGKRQLSNVSAQTWTMKHFTKWVYASILMKN